MDPELIKQITPYDYYTSYFSQGLRPDHRAIEKARQVAISYSNGMTTIKLGNSALVCRPSETVEEAWPGLEILGPMKVQINVLNDDGNLTELVSLACQLSSDVSNFVLSFTFAEVCGFYVRDPTKDEENIASSIFTIFIAADKINVLKTKGRPIAMRDLETLIDIARSGAENAISNLIRAKKGTFIGELY